MAGREVVLPAVMDALRRVAPPGTDVRPSTALESLGVDSLGLLEVLLNLETATGLHLSEEAVRRLSLELPADSGLTVESFAQALVQAGDGMAHEG